MTVQKKYFVHFLRKLKGSVISSVVIPIEASNSFAAIKRTEDLMAGWTPVRVKRTPAPVKEEESNEE